MKRMQMLACLAGLGATLCTVGCASPGIRHAYGGPRKAPAELATVWGTTNQGYRVFSPARERISITEVDGDSTTPWYSMASYPTAVHILPGRHKLDVQYEFIHGVANGPVWVDAQTNRTYQIKVMNPQARTQRVYFVIEDVTAQTLVGGGDKQTP